MKCEYYRVYFCEMRLCFVTPCITKLFWALKRKNWNWNQTFRFPLYLLIDHLEITRLHQTKLCVPVDDLLKKTPFEHPVPRILWGIPRPISHINTAVGSLLAVYNASHAYWGHWLCALFIFPNLIEPGILTDYVPTHISSPTNIM